MRKLIPLGVAAFTLLACGGEDPSASTSAAEKGSPTVKKIFESERMLGVARPYAGPTAADNAIRGFGGGGLPWVIEEGEAKISEDGTVDVTVHHLVFDPNDETVIARGLAGQNTVAAFRAIVSCQSIEAGAAVVKNVSTDPFPATTGLGGGDAHILQKVTIPSPCYAPIVFVTSPAGNWFAATAL
jgi:hypothetical protein